MLEPLLSTARLEKDGALRKLHLDAWPHPVIVGSTLTARVKVDSGRAWPPSRTQTVESRAQRYSLSLQVVQVNGLAPGHVDYSLLQRWEGGDNLRDLREHGRLWRRRDLSSVYSLHLLAFWRRHLAGSPAAPRARRHARNA